MLTREKVIDILSERWAKLGQQTLDDGTLQFGRKTDFWWYNEIYPCLTDEEVTYMEKYMGRPIPREYREFLLNCGNGMCYMVGEIALHGLTDNYKPDLNVGDPFSLIELNQFVPRNTPANIFFIGSSCDGKGYNIYINSDDNKVYLCFRDDVTPLYLWDSIEDMLTIEIPRMNDCFNDLGERIIEDMATMPVHP